MLHHRHLARYECLCFIFVFYAQDLNLPIHHGMSPRNIVAPFSMVEREQEDFLPQRGFNTRPSPNDLLAYSNG